MYLGYFHYYEYCDYFKTIRFSETWTFECMCYYYYYYYCDHLETCGFQRSGTLGVCGIITMIITIIENPVDFRDMDHQTLYVLLLLRQLLLLF